MKVTNPYTLEVSIHAPREGCDTNKTNQQIAQQQFQFTHPGRGATDVSYDLTISVRVSIHAPREGCDGDYTRIIFRQKFQFTHPGRGATSLG